jgi:acid phosphatase type 7
LTGGNRRLAISSILDARGGWLELRTGSLAGFAVVTAIFMTVAAMPARAADPVVAAAGDIACDPGDRYFNGGIGTPIACRQKYTSDLLVGRGLAGVLALGDLQYEDATLGKFLASYDPTWGRVKSITHPAVGNHEYATYGAAGYFDYFNGVGVQTGPAGDRLGLGYYSFNIGAWHLIALNSNCNDVLRGCGVGSPQEQWLRQDLASSPAACTLAYWHHPLFTSGNHSPGIDSTRPLFQALQDYGAELVLTGHDHNYERFAPQTANGQLDRAHGIRQFVVGTGGRIPYLQGTPMPNSEVRDHTSFGVLELTLHPTSYEWRFVPALGSSFTDSGSESCKGPPGYPRPLASGGMTVKLVPTFSPCTAPNAVHGAPLDVPACGPPVQGSRYLTAGSPNGVDTRFRGYARMRVAGQRPVDPSDGDQADVKIDVGIEDVRRAADRSDYAGQLQAQIRLRITDRSNGALLRLPATATDLPLSFTIPCQTTPADSRTGSTCRLTSSVDSVMPGTVREGSRSVWQVLGVSVNDGGADGLAITPGNTEFARAGLFAP